MPEKHTILGGKVHVYRRDNSSLWQCSTYLAGKNRRVSTKEDGLAKAKDFATGWGEADHLLGDAPELKGQATWGARGIAKNIREPSSRITRGAVMLPRSAPDWRRMACSPTGSGARTAMAVPGWRSCFAARVGHWRCASASNGSSRWT